MRSKTSLLVVVGIFLLSLAGVPVSQGGQGVSSLIEVGEDEGGITIESFNRLIREYPDRVHLIDTRDRDEVVADGSFKHARLMAIDEVEAAVGELPTDKPIVFFCSTGSRAMEAYDIVQMKRNDLEVYFLDAIVEFGDREYPKVSPPD